MTHLERASRRLFDDDGLSAANFGIALGTSRDVFTEQVADQINRALSQLEAGDFEPLVLD